MAPPGCPELARSTIAAVNILILSAALLRVSLEWRAVYALKLSVLFITSR